MGEGNVSRLFSAQKRSEAKNTCSGGISAEKLHKRMVFMPSDTNTALHAGPYCAIIAHSGTGIAVRRRLCMSGPHVLADREETAHSARNFKEVRNDR